MLVEDKCLVVRSFPDRCVVNQRLEDLVSLRLLLSLIFLIVRLNLRVVFLLAFCKDAGSYATPLPGTYPQPGLNLLHSLVFLVSLRLLTFVFFLGLMMIAMV